MADGGSTDEVTGVVPQIVQYPSDDLRPIPGFTFALPADWTFTEAADAVVVAGTPAGRTDAWANLVVQHSRVERPYDIEAAAKESWALEQAIAPGAEIEDEWLFRTEHNTFYLRGVTYPDDGSGFPASQAHAKFFGPDRDHDLLDLFSATFLADPDHIEALATTFVDILRSFRFD